MRIELCAGRVNGTVVTALSKRTPSRAMASRAGVGTAPADGTETRSARTVSRVINTRFSVRGGYAGTFLSARRSPAQPAKSASANATTANRLLASRLILPDVAVRPTLSIRLRWPYNAGSFSTLALRADRRFETCGCASST